MQPLDPRSAPLDADFQSFLPEGPDFPLAVDSSMRAAFAACPRKFNYQYMRHLQHKGGSVHLVAGGAFARGTEVTRKSFYDGGMGLDDALAEGLKAATSEYGNFEPPSYGSGANKSLERVLEGLVYYFHQYPPASDHCQPHKLANGKSAIEFRFALPTDVRHPVTGEPILYFGRCDMLVHYNGSLFIFDDKTTSQLGAGWPDSWKLRAQIDGYIWAAQQYGLNPMGAIIRGLSFLKSSFGTAESMQVRSQWQIQRWYHQLQRDIQRMVDCWKAGYWDFSLDQACTAYGNCGFAQLCSVEDPEPWIDQDYEVRKWEPLEVQLGD